MTYFPLLPGLPVWLSSLSMQASLVYAVFVVGFVAGWFLRLREIAEVEMQPVAARNKRQTKPQRPRPVTRASANSRAVRPQRDQTRAASP